MLPITVVSKYSEANTHLQTFITHGMLIFTDLCLILNPSHLYRIDIETGERFKAEAFNRHFK